MSKINIQSLSCDNEEKLCKMVAEFINEIILGNDLYTGEYKISYTHAVSTATYQFKDNSGIDITREHFYIAFIEFENT